MLKLLVNFQEIFQTSKQKMNEFFQNPTHEETQISQKSGLRPSKVTNNGPFKAMKTSKSIFQLLSTISNALIHVTGATTSQALAHQNQL